MAENRPELQFSPNQLKPKLPRYETTLINFLQVLQSRKSASQLSVLIILFLTNLILGCSGKIIEQNMESMLGEPVDKVFSKLGLPDSESVVAGYRFYLWDTQDQGSYSIPQFHTSTIYTPSGHPITYTYTTYNQFSYNHFCQLRIFVDSYDNIITYDYEGNEGDVVFLQVN